MFRKNKLKNNANDTSEKKYKPDKAAEILGLPQGTFKNFPSIQIRGNREIIIDGCTGLLSYADDTILVETKFCRIKIAGRNLTLKNLSKSILAVRGFIQNVGFNM